MQAAAPIQPPVEEQDDPVASFFANRRDAITPRWTDSMVFELNATIEAALAKPLSFSPMPKDKHPKMMTEDCQPLASLSRSRMPLRVRPSLAPKITKTVPPSKAAVLEPQPQLASITTQVGGLELGQSSTHEDPNKQTVARALFSDIQQPLITNPNEPPPAATKTKKPAVPSRRSTRQVGAKNDVPVANLETLRLVQGLGILGPNEAMTADAAKKFVQRFDQPLFQEEIDGLALLTRLNRVALRIAAGLDGHSSSATSAD